MMPDQPPRIHVCDDWINVTLPDRESILSAQASFAAHRQWTEIVPGMDSIAVRFDPALLCPDDAADRIGEQLGGAANVPERQNRDITIPVCYEGEFAPDLAFVAGKLGIDAEALPGWHASRKQRVAMLGFMPGFAYLESPEPCSVIGRLAEPRQRIPAGSIGIIGQQSCIYSFDSPGGWPIIGRTPRSLFDAALQPPALLFAGQTVRFEPISRTMFDEWTPAAR
ncbi:5-oxoprolinase subunit B family protein [Parasphingorhabdus sp.]|uniref:5-oxoprolinase subunit B family protein n=1 Tax=Parasphingorhabdus sp. TaxID=2709688 RepID=UPI00300352BE